MTSHVPLWGVLTATTAAIIAMIVLAFLLPSVTYRVPAVCSHAAHEAQTVISHNHTYKPFIDRLTGPYRSRYARSPLVIGDTIPSFDGRVPDLAACK